MKKLCCAIRCGGLWRLGCCRILLGNFEEGRFDLGLVKEMAKLGLFGMHLEGYGCAGAGPMAYGIACRELEAGDSGLRSFLSVQGSLSMTAIRKFGSEEHCEEFLPAMAAGETLGCFGLTEPDAGSDPASMRTNAKQDGGKAGGGKAGGGKDGSDWILNGHKAVDHQRQHRRCRCYMGDD